MSLYLVQASWATARGNMGGTAFLVRAPSLDGARTKAARRIYRDGRTKVDVRITERTEDWP